MGDADERWRVTSRIPEHERRLDATEPEIDTARFAVTTS
jgi:hypothetical protein